MSVMVGSVSSNAPKPLVLTPAAARPPVLSPWHVAWQRLKGNQLALLGVLIVLIYGGMALGADALAPYSYRHFDFQVVEGDPSYAHFLGTDFVGRDVFTLIMYGARVSFSVAVVVPLLIILIGVPLGLVAGFFGGRLDTLIMRITDIMFAFPSFLFTVLIILTFRAQPRNDFRGAGNFKLAVDGAAGAQPGDAGQTGGLYSGSTRHRHAAVGDPGTACATQPRWNHRRDCCPEHSGRDHGRGVFELCGHWR